MLRGSFPDLTFPGQGESCKIRDPFGGLRSEIFVMWLSSRYRLSSCFMGKNKQDMLVFKTWKQKKTFCLKIHFEN